MRPGFSYWKVRIETWVLPRQLTGREAMAGEEAGGFVHTQGIWVHMHTIKLFTGPGKSQEGSWWLFLAESVEPHDFGAFALFRRFVGGGV